MPTVKVVEFSLNNYEGRKRPSKINFGESMIDLIESARNKAEGKSVYLMYKPRNTLYYVASTEVMVKQDDDSWKKCVRYIDCFNGGKEYVRAPELFNMENWLVLTRQAARDMFRTGKLPE